MDVMEFFKKSEGNWFSHRTGHYLGARKQEAGKSEVSFTCYERDHPKVLAVCELHQVDPASVAGGAEVTWTGTTAFDEKTHQNMAFLVPVPDKDDPLSGLILRNKGYAEEVPVAGRYRMHADESMTLVTENSATESEERLWFVSANLRLRTGVVKHAGGFSITTFCSEIRRLPPEPAKAEQEVKS
jgi:phycoerythrin-associated linker protein